jgi:N6-L-threonylcarbamoyladenine synthase
MKKECEKEGVFLQYPSISLCTDNAAMIGSAAYFEYIKGITHDLDLNAVANLKLKNKL